MDKSDKVETSMENIKSANKVVNKTSTTNSKYKFDIKISARPTRVKSLKCNLGLKCNNPKCNPPPTLK